MQCFILWSTLLFMKIKKNSLLLFLVSIFLLQTIYIYLESIWTSCWLQISSSFGSCLWWYSWLSTEMHDKTQLQPCASLFWDHQNHRICALWHKRNRWACIELDHLTFTYFCRMKTLLKLFDVTLLDSSECYLYYYDFRHSLNVISFFWTLNGINFLEI